MHLIEIFSIILIHWFAYFLMQDEKWALGKSKNCSDLLNHTFTYTLCWFVIFFISMLSLYFYEVHTNKFIQLPFTQNIFWFFPITLITHTLTNYFTSKIVSKKFEKREYGSSIPNIGAFTIIGIDQVLHYIQLFTTYWLLIKK
jgi:hypothetical protein